VWAIEDYPFMSFEVPMTCGCEAQGRTVRCAGTSSAEVDSVLTSGEVQQLLEAHGRALSDLPAARLDSLVPGTQQDGRLYGLPGGSGSLSFPLPRPLLSA